MTDYLEPSNSNLTFSDLMKNKDRDLAEDAIREDVQLLERSGVSNTAIADTLFKFLKASTAPPKSAPDGAYAVWYLQLKRFRDELQSEIDKLERIMGKTH